MKNFKFYWKSYKFFKEFVGIRMQLLLISSLMVGFLDGLGLALFLPLLKMADESNSESQNNGNFFNEAFSFFHISPSINSILIVMLLFFILKGVALLFNEYIKVAIEQKFIRKLRNSLLNLLNSISFAYFVKSDIGRIQNTMTGEVGRVVTAFTSFTSVLQQMLLVVVYCIFAFQTNAVFALFVTIGGILSSFAFSSLYTITMNNSAFLTKRSNNFQGLVIQHVSNFKYLKATGTIDKYSDKLRKTILAIEESNTKIGVLKAILTATREPILVAIIVSTIIIQVKYFEASIGSILVSLLFFYRSLSFMFTAQTSLNQFMSVSGSLENMSNFQKELNANLESENGELAMPFSKSIEFNKVCLSYGQKQVLKQIDLVIKDKSTVAIVGPSGSGKTSLINILVGLVKPNSGTLIVDGNDITTIDKMVYQKGIGYITQESVIFEDTIFNNITFWDDYSAENILRFREAISLANIAELIESLPDNEHSLLGINGVNLSGGQRQRISIARELYKNSSILVLDEATSALDSESEDMIRTNINNLKGKYTMVMVAHRLSTVRSADLIVLLNDGEIIAQGTFNEMIKDIPEFKKMVELQSL